MILYENVMSDLRDEYRKDKKIKATNNQTFICALRNAVGSNYTRET